MYVADLSNIGQKQARWVKDNLTKHFWSLDKITSLYFNIFYHFHLGAFTYDVRFFSR